jgi:hypothetical protein
METREIYLVIFISAICILLGALCFGAINYDRFITKKGQHRIEQSYPIVFATMMFIWIAGWIYLASRQSWKFERKDVYLIVFSSVIIIWMIVGVYLALNYDRLFGKRKLKGQNR